MNRSASIPAMFDHARVKQSDEHSAAVMAAVPCDFAAGITAQFRAYRPTADPNALAVDYQIAPDNAPLPPLIADQAGEDPYRLKDAYIGWISVTGPDGKTYVNSGADSVPVDLTQGLNVTFTYAATDVHTSPIGPLLNIDIAPVGP